MSAPTTTGSELVVPSISGTSLRKTPVFFSDSKESAVPSAIKEGERIHDSSDDDENYKNSLKLWDQL